MVSWLTLAIDVIDEGTIVMEPAAASDGGTSAAYGQGSGLALARSVAEASGGGLLLTRASPATLTFILPGPPGLPR